MFRVETRSLDGAVTALGSAGPYTLVVDRPIEGGGGGLGFNGGQLLHLAIAGCISNDLFREAARLGITLTRVQVLVDGDFDGDPAVSAGIRYQVIVDGDRPRGRAGRPGAVRGPHRRDPEFVAPGNRGHAGREPG